MRDSGREPDSTVVSLLPRPVGNEVAASHHLGNVLQSADEGDCVERSVECPTGKAFPSNRKPDRHQRHRGANKRDGTSEPTGETHAPPSRKIGRYAHDSM
jgi:hypothetical protein